MAAGRGFETHAIGYNAASATAAINSLLAASKLNLLHVMSFVYYRLHPDNFPSTLLSWTEEKKHNIILAVSGIFRKAIQEMENLR
jgi:hypothetical protein